MKTCLTIAVGLAFAVAAVCAQNLPTYQGIISGQSPYYYNSLDGTYTPTIGTGTLVPSANDTGFGSDYFGNAGDALYFTDTVARATDAIGTHEIYNSGVANANSIGSMSFMFYVPTNALTSTSARYIFDNGDSSPDDFYLKMSNSVLLLAVGNISTITNATSLVPGTWYYWAATWNFSGANSSAYGINWYLGAAGGSVTSLTSGFKQRGGSGNISSSAILGSGSTFELSGQPAGSGGFQISGVPGLVDEVATWSNQLNVAQIDSQYDALIIVPEPATLALVGIGGLFLLFGRGTFRRRVSR
ncbi:MAG TPA: PEP-CTERM sorting domain-containing protein [Verrucomicrobiae bacterium]|nr:PEP-CTERM sorting domain-containing protein [Verrucomicrobiae bacterium]